MSLILSLIGLLLLWWIPARQARTLSDDTTMKRFDAENEARRTLAQVFGGALVLISLYFTAKTLNVSQEGQITDRFVKALDLLGRRDSVEAKLGGIYSLARIAHDSQRDHIPTMKILAASARRMSLTLTPGGEPPPEMQAILEVIVNRNLKNETALDNYIDLRGVVAPRAYLIHANFTRINMLCANLSGAVLNGSTFTDIFAQDADLKGAWLQSTTITAPRANFKNAQLDYAHLDRSIIKNAYFEGASFIGTTFKDSKIDHCNFKGAHLQGVRFEAETIDSSFLDGADLRDADFRKVHHLRNLKLHGAQVGGLKINQSQLRNLTLDPSQISHLSIGEHQ